MKLLPLMATFFIGALAFVFLYEHGAAPAQTPAPPPSVLPDCARVLSSSDLQFQGVSLVPTTLDDFSYGGLASRVVNGQRNFFVTGIQQKGQGSVFEFTCAAFAPDLPTAISQKVRGTLVKNWGTTIYGTGWTQPLSGFLQTDGLWWDDVNQGLWTLREPNYSVTGANNQVLGFSQLNADGTSQAFGPWLTSQNSHASCNWLTPIPQWFQQATGCGPYGLGAGLGSGDAPASFGPDLLACTLPSPANTPANTIIPTQALSFFPLSSRSPRDANYQLVDAHVTAFPPPVNGVGVWGEGDWLKGCVWIDLPDVTGVLYTGRLFHGHVWYGDASLNVVNADGSTSTYKDTVNGSRGNHSDQYDASWLIVSPDQLAQVAAGKLPASGVRASEVFDPTALIPVFPVSNRKVVTGAYFDAASRTLWTVSPLVETPAGTMKHLPVVCQWHVKASGS